MRLLTHNFELVEACGAEGRGALGRLRADLCAKGVWYRGGASRLLSLRMVFSDGSLCMVLYRAMRALRRWHLAPLAAALYKANSLLTRAVIGRGAQFGPGLVILHSVGIVVNSSVRAGRNVVIESGVTVGAEKGESPVLGDNVFLGAGAKVIGGVKLGNRVRVGANAVVVDDIPEGATAVGVPARVVKVRGE